MEKFILELEIPKEMLPFLDHNDTDIKLKQSALFLYSYIHNLTISCVNF